MHKMVRRGAAALAALAVAGSAPAQEALIEEGQWYVSPMASYVVDDEERASNGGFGGQLGAGRLLTPHVALELNAFGARLDGFNDVGQAGVGLDLLGLGNLNGNVAPYVLFGVGYLQSQYSEGPGIGFVEDTENFSLSVGGGGLFRLGGGPLRLRTEARLRNDLTDGSNLTDVVLSAGLLVPIGETTPPPPPDADRDGVDDARDRCPGTPAGAIVDAEGCELDSDRDGVVDRVDQCPGTATGVRVNDVGCAFDSDGDGVPDGEDRCPDTPRGTLVGSDGCPLDSDGDGVPDARDQCPGTTPGVRVDYRGCEIREEIQLPGVTFETESAVLTESSLDTLDGAVQTLRRYPDIEVECAGHTDSRGAADYNRRLSQERAEAVCEYLESRGIDEDRLRARGYGESQPIEDNATAEGRRANRRVTLRVLD